MKYYSMQVKFDDWLTDSSKDQDKTRVSNLSISLPLPLQVSTSTSNIAREVEICQAVQKAGQF